MCNGREVLIALRGTLHSLSREVSPYVVQDSTSPNFPLFTLFTPDSNFPGSSEIFVLLSCWGLFNLKVISRTFVISHKLEP